jgi:hypothetical protein
MGKREKAIITKREHNKERQRKRDCDEDIESVAKRLLRRKKSHKEIMSMGKREKVLERECDKKRIQ